MVTRNYGEGLYGGAVFGKATTYQVAADQAGYVYTGIAVGMWWGRYTLIAAYSSFVHTGQPAGLRLTRWLTAAYGAITEAGQVANLSRALKLFPDTTSHAFTGSAASLFAARMLGFGHSAFLLSSAERSLARGSVWTPENEDAAVWSDAPQISDLWTPSET